MKFDYIFGMFAIRGRIIKVYDTVDSFVYVLKMSEVAANKRDGILRYLFRKQLERRKNLRNL